MSVFDDFDLILDYAHMWNWVPDWYLAQSIYKKFPESYSILTPFAYSYLEEMIRTTTSDYELPLFDRDKQPVKVSVGMALIALAIKENQNNPDYVALLEQAKRHFKYTQISIDENGRNSVMHGRFHPRFWTKESFEQLIHDIAVLKIFTILTRFDSAT